MFLELVGTALVRLALASRALLQGQALKLLHAVEECERHRRRLTVAALLMHRLLRIVLGLEPMHDEVTMTKGMRH